MLKGDSCTSSFAREKRKNTSCHFFFFLTEQVTNAPHKNFAPYFEKTTRKKMFKSKCLKAAPTCFLFSHVEFLGVGLKK